MPVVILLDTSLSMSRPVPMADCSEEYSRHHLAIQGINVFLEYLTDHCRLEFVSLVEFSSSLHTRVPFTRDLEQIKAALAEPTDKLGDKTCIEIALRAISAHVIEEWGVHNPIQVLLVTDGNVGIGEGSLRRSFHEHSHSLPLPYLFPCKLHVLCVAPPGDSSLQSSVPLYERLIRASGGGGEVFTPDGSLHKRSVQAMFTRLSEKFFTPFHGSLKCGNLKCDVQLFPPPDVYKKDHEFEHVDKSLSRVMEICGFLDISDFASPPYISRHLILPSMPITDASHSDSNKEEEEDGEGKLAAFTVLLHGSLKVESMMALTQLAEDWYGIIYSWADNKKKSNLLLSVFKPGVSHIPWLGSINQLAPIEDFPVSPYGGDDDPKSPFPIRPSERRSYAQNCVVWLKQTGIQADIQKILRNARKLPEKQLHFYKELNRLRKAALAFGFMDLMDAVAQLLERECTMLPGNAHPDAALQLTHAASSLRNDTLRDVSQTITPLRTNFTGD